MTDSEIVRYRLHNQHIARQQFREPHQLVAWLGAVQAQDYPAAKWAVGQRVQSATDAAVERAFADGRILRTHVMRPTWHFVPREDIRWMLSLTAPRVLAAMARADRMLELDAATVSRSNHALARALHGGRMLTRRELAVILRRAGIATDNVMRMGHLMARAELAAIVCSGIPRGKQQTYALLEERAPEAKTLGRDEALAELGLRYFSGHGPATMKDYAWWSGLTSADARRSIEMIAARLRSEEVDGRTYWWSASARAPQRLSSAAHLLPNFDEYIVGYTDRHAVWDGPPPENPRANILFNHVVVVEGRVVGTWKRLATATAATLSIVPAARLGPGARAALAAAAERYGRFLGGNVTLRIESRQSQRQRGG